MLRNRLYCRESLRTGLTLGALTTDALQLCVCALPNLCSLSNSQYRSHVLVDEIRHFEA